MQGINTATATYDFLFGLFNPSSKTQDVSDKQAFEEVMQDTRKSDLPSTEHRNAYTPQNIEVVNGHSVRISDAPKPLSVGLERAVAVQHLKFTSREDRDAFYSQKVMSTEAAGGLTMASTRDAIKNNAPSSRPVALGSNTNFYSKVPDSQGEEDASHQSAVKNLLEMVEVEKALKAKYGDDIRLGYSGDQGWKMFRPGDTHYDSLKTGEEALGQLQEDIERGFYRPNEFDALFQQYGYKDLISDELLAIGSVSR